MKVAPILRELRRRAEAGDTAVFEPLLVHTGQHYDAAMNASLFHDLGMPDPDEFLGVGSDSHAKQTAKIMIAFDGVCDRHSLDAVLVVGDVNSTIACALVASKRSIGVIHVEAGLRSYDRSMPEEVNRVMTDQISDLLLITSEEAFGNLEREGIDRSRVRMVGNPMIDSLLSILGSMPLQSSWVSRMLDRGRGYVVVTLHRPSNVDSIDDLLEILEGLREVSRDIPLLFPVHPRTAKSIAASGFELAAAPGADIGPGLYALPPLGYADFIDLMRGAALVLTDSGGIQEETTMMGIPCATLRPNTERPVTVTMGTNEIIPPTHAAVVKAVRQVLAGSWKEGCQPPMWDGRSAGRIVDAVLDSSWRQGVELLSR
jgi:UDP-N-acetylglucosamine 2-epimerase (non-hydrolysing)